MSKLGISTGRIPNDGTGDTLLSGAVKINRNFDEIYSYFGDGTNLTFTNDGSSRWARTTSGINTLSNVGIGTTNPRFALEVGAVGASGTSLLVNGNARVTGILSVGQGTVTINGNNDTITASNIVVTSSITGGGILTTSNLIGYATEGYVNNAVVGFITSGALSGFATEGYVNNSLVGYATQGYVTNAVVGFITSGALSGFATEGYVNSAVVGFITSGALSGYATETFVTNALVGYATQGYVNSAVVGFVTFGALSGYATEGYVNSSVVGFITSGSLVGYATEGYVNSAIASFAGGSSQWISTTSGIHTLSNVGIGTTNSTSALTVTGSGTSTSQLYVTGFTTCTNNLGVIYTSGFNPGINLNDTSSKTLIGMYYDTSSTQSYLISDEKNINIKVRAPQDVHITAGDETMAVFESNAGVTLFYNNSQKFETTNTGVTVTGTTFTNQLNVSGVSTFAGIITSTKTGDNGATFNSTAGQAYVVLNSDTNFTSFLDFKENGTLKGNIAYSPTASGALEINSASNRNVVIATGGGNVGVGTTNPTSTLTVNGNISASAGVLAGFSTFTAIRFANDAGNNTAQYITNIGPNYVIGFNTGGGYPEDKYFQFSSGNPNFILENVGIGTTNATSKLTVRGGDISVGVSTAHGVILTSPNGTQYRLIVDDSGALSTVAV